MKKRRNKNYAKCEICGIENKSVKKRYHNGRDCVGKGAKYIGTFCSLHQPTGEV